MNYLENKSYSDKISEWEWLKDKQVFVACSGGVDSIVLTHLLVVIGAKVQVLHVNYMLRGGDSELDAQFVATFCSRLNLEFHLKKVDTNSLLIEKKQNLQKLAREIRYEWFNQILTTHENAYLALGHHSDDQVETFFLQLARKSGLMGLSGMLPIKDRYLRPLLKFTKQELYALSVENGWEWREDSSNKTLKYARNKLRNELLPQLYIEIPDLKQSVLFLVDKFQQSQYEIEQRMAPLVEQIKTSKKWKFSIFDKLTSDEKIEVMRRLHLDVSQLEQLLKLRHSQKGSKRLLNQYEIFKGNEWFYFSDLKQSFKYSLAVEQVEKLPDVFTKNVVYIDPEKIDGSLLLRTWKKGDRMKLLGLKGTKLISDILKDSKIESAKRKDWPLLCDGKDILWCYKCALSDKAISKFNSKVKWKVSIIEEKL